MKKLLLIILVSLVFGSEITAQSIKQKDKWGTSIYFVEGQAIKQKDKWGQQLFFLDGQTIKNKDKWGAALYYLDGNVIRQKDKWGPPLIYFDGNTIRQKDKWGQALYYLDGNVLKIKDKWGTPIYYFECIPEKWIIACTKRFSQNVQFKSLLWYHEFKKACFVIAKSPWKVLRAFVESGLSLLFIYGCVPAYFYGLNFDFDLVQVMGRMVLLNLI